MRGSHCALPFGLGDVGRSKRGQGVDGGGHLRGTKRRQAFVVGLPDPEARIKAEPEQQNTGDQGQHEELASGPWRLLIQPPTHPLAVGFVFQRVGVGHEVGLSGAGDGHLSDLLFQDQTFTRQGFAKSLERFRRMHGGVEGQPTLEAPVFG